MADPHAAAPELKRLRWLLRAAFLWAVIIFVRLAWLQTYAHQRLQVKADRQQEEGFALQPPRGEIVTADGAFLAISVPAWSVIVDPRKLSDEEAGPAVALLARTLHLNHARLSDDMAKARAKHRGYLRVKAKAEPAEYQALKAWVDAENGKTLSLKDDVDWLTFRQESWRAYPNAQLGASLVGSVDAKENGYSGIEQTLQNDLQGTPGWVLMLKDARDRNVNALEIQEPVPGKRVTLTINSQLQSLTDRSLAEAVRGKNFESGTIVVMNPNNGEILAMSAYPSFDPNSPPKTKADVEARVHRAIAQALDGGSVMKMFTISGALEYTDLRPSSLIESGAFYYTAKDKIRDTHDMGMIPIEQGLWISSNGVAIRVGKRLGREKLYKTLRDFGFGQKTGIDLPGESAGVLWPLENKKNPRLQWQPTSHYFISIGHEIGVTTIQLAQACSVIANGGYRIKPKLVRSKQAEGSEIEWEPESPKVRVISGGTAADMRTMSEGVVLKGTGKRARIVGRTVGGKTGTAQMLDKRGRYVTIYSSSFMGYSPLNAPKVVVVVTLNGGKLYGGDAAAPVFAAITEAALSMLGEPPDVPMSAPPPSNLAEVPEAEPAPEAAPVSFAAASHTVSGDEVVTGGAVPDFNGLDKRAVARIAAERGLPVEMRGAGLVRSQSPPPGSVLALGAAVHLRFAR